MINKDKRMMVDLPIKSKIAQTLDSLGPAQLDPAGGGVLLLNILPPGASLVVVRQPVLPTMYRDLKIVAIDENRTPNVFQSLFLGKPPVVWFGHNAQVDCINLEARSVLGTAHFSANFSRMIPIVDGQSVICFSDFEIVRLDATGTCLWKSLSTHDMIIDISHFKGSQFQISYYEGGNAILDADRGGIR